MTTIRALIAILALLLSIATPASAEDMDPEVAAIASIVAALEGAAAVEDPFDATRDPQWDPIFVDRLWDAEIAFRRLRLVMFDDQDYDRTETRNLLTLYYNPAADELRYILTHLINGDVLGPRAVWEVVFKVGTVLMGRIRTPTRAARAAIAICDKLPEALKDPRTYIGGRLRLEFSDDILKHFRKPAGD